MNIFTKILIKVTDSIPQMTPFPALVRVPSEVKPEPTKNNPSFDLIGGPLDGKEFTSVVNGKFQYMEHGITHNYSVDSSGTKAVYIGATHPDWEWPRA